MSENIKQRYSSSQTNVSNPFRNVDLSDGSPAIDGDVIMFGGICNSAGTEIALATSTLQSAGNAILIATENTLSTLNGKVTACNTGAVVISSALPAGTNNIGDVDVLSLPALPAGTNNIGDVDILTAPFAGVLAGAQPANAVQLGYFDGAEMIAANEASRFPVRLDYASTDYYVVIGGSDGGTARQIAVDSNGYVYVNSILYIGGTAADVGNGTVGSGTQRVTLASNSTGTLAGVTTVTTLTGGGIAHDSADSGNPVKVGAKAASSLASATLVSAADRTNLVSDLDGALLVRHGAPLGDNKSTSQSVTDTTSTAATNFGAVASTKNVITEITVYNTSATPTFVKIQDGSGGSTFWTVPAPANGGSVIQFDRGLKQPSANTALYFAANDSASTVYISINGYQSKV